jgi:hypothetical protein
MIRKFSVFRILTLVFLLFFWISNGTWGYTDPQMLPPLEIQTNQSLPLNDNYVDILGKKIFRWNDKTHYLMIYIQDGRDQPGWNPENIQRVQAAFSEWERAMSPRFRFIYMPDTRGSDVTVSWKGFSEKEHRGDKAGQNSTITWGKYLQKNDIEIALNNSKGVPYNPIVIQSVALHEIGHMLGIKGHSNQPQDVMAAASDLYNLTAPQHLTQRDVNTLKLIYQEKPNYTNPENVHLSNFDQFKKRHPGGFSIMWIMVGFVPIPIPLPF